MQNRDSSPSGKSGSPTSPTDPVCKTNQPQEKAKQEKPKQPRKRRPYEEIGAMFNGNEVHLQSMILCFISHFDPPGSNCNT